MTSELETCNSPVTGAGVRLLNDAFARMLGRPTVGAMAFCRSLKPDVVEALAADPAFSPGDWQVCAVTGEADAAGRQITSDQAVELREDKCDGVLLLIDPQRAGAGMDGIYSSAREISEKDLFDRTVKIARSSIGPERAAKVEAAFKRARQVGERRAVSRWQEFEFLSRVYDDPESFGRSLPHLGLWPVAATPEQITEEDLTLSVRMVERLLLGTGTEKTASACVESLLLLDPSHSQQHDLERTATEASRRPVAEILHKIADQEHLWIRELDPKFLSQELQAIEIKDWRSRTGSLYKWSGLTDGDEGELPQFVLNREIRDTAKQPRLHVRFTTLPTEIPKGAIEFRVSVMSGEDELAWRQMTHSGKAELTVKFTLDDFQDLPDDSQHEARIQVTAEGHSEIPEAFTEEFLLRFGDVESQTLASNAKRIRCLGEGAIHIGDVEAFDSSCDDPACYDIDDAKGLVVFRSRDMKSTCAVCRPPLGAEIERLQTEQTGIGRWSIAVRADGTRVGTPEFHELEPGSCPSAAWDKLQKLHQKLRNETLERGGFWGRIWAGNQKTLEDTLNAWAGAIDEGASELALAETIEVRSLSGAIVGVIVLPSHPLRLAWQTAYDQLLRHFRYESGVKPKEITDSLHALDAAHFPAVLPGVDPGQRIAIYAYGGVTGGSRGLGWPAGRIDRALNFSASRDARGDRASCDFKLGLMADRVAR